MGPERRVRSENARNLAVPGVLWGVLNLVGSCTVPISLPTQNPGCPGFCFFRLNL